MNFVILFHIYFNGAGLGCILFQRIKILTKVSKLNLSVQAIMESFFFQMARRTVTKRVLNSNDYFYLEANDKNLDPH